MHTPSSPFRRTTTALGVAALLAVAGGCGGTPATPAPDGPTVTTRLLSFDPAEITVKAGTTVTWHVSDSIQHTVTTGRFTLGGDGLRTDEAPDGLIDLPLGPGHDVSFTFAKPGKYTYYCSIHRGMTGDVVVEP